SASDVPDFLSSDWLETRKKKPLGPRLNFNAEEAVEYQLEALKYNDKPRPDYGVEVMYRFAGFDPFERSTYFGRQFDLGQFERFRRIFHHSTYRVLLGHKEREILSRLWVEENQFKQRVWVRGARPEEEEIFQFTMVQESWRLMGWLLANRELDQRRRGRILRRGCLLTALTNQLEEEGGPAAQAPESSWMLLHPIIPDFQSVSACCGETC
uniref:Uncharacterized protein n=1 Tax=Aegilops tauschii subsp. strangulata TaxID=200361 RepID=A0A452ZZF7_AEGTS